MLKRSLPIAVAVVLGAAAIAWASGGDRRAAAKGSFKISRLELSCDASAGLVRASISTRLRLPRVVRAAGNRLELIVRISRDRQMLATARVTRKARSLRSTVDLKHDVQFTDRQSQRVARAAAGSSSGCADAQPSRQLRVTLTYAIRGGGVRTTRLGQTARWVPLDVQPDGSDESDTGDPPDDTQPTTDAEWCDALPARTAPIVESDEINEASGLVASRRHDDVFWTHNDSGDSARLFAIDGDGRSLGTYTLSGATNRDWEDIAIGPAASSGDYMYIGDIGDNAATRSYVTVYRVAEPSERPSGGGAHTLASVQSQKLTYPDGARDAETLLVDPLDGSLYVITKRETRSRIYRARPAWDGSTEALDFLGELTWGGVVAGDVSPDGHLVALKGYLSIRMYDRDPGSSLASVLTGEGRAVPYLPEPQGEALALCGSSGVYLTLSEGAHPALYAYRD